MAALLAELRDLAALLKDSVINQKDDDDMKQTLIDRYKQAHTTGLLVLLVLTQFWDPPLLDDSPAIQSSGASSGAHSMNEKFWSESQVCIHVHWIEV